MTYYLVGLAIALGSFWLVLKLRFPFAVLLAATWPLAFLVLGALLPFAYADWQQRTGGRGTFLCHCFGHSWRQVAGHLYECRRCPAGGVSTSR